MPDDRSLNLLEDPVISTRLEQGPSPFGQLTLPEVLEACAHDAIEDFPYLRTFQEHPWHALLTQLAALAMVNVGMTTFPDTADVWQMILADLTEDEHPGQEPWHLLVEDQDRPAFLQPPTLDPTFITKARLNPQPARPRLFLTPDAIDIPVASRHHEVKTGHTHEPKTEHWLFALVSCQTAHGYSGPYTYGISRMNGAYSNRHSFSITPSHRWGAHIVRDATVLAREYEHNEVRHLLLWLRPWQGLKNEAIDPESIRPWPLYVEICRRMRLRPDPAVPGAIQAAASTTRSRRIDAGARKGLMDDPWTLAHKDRSTTVAINGFNASALTQYLSPDTTTLPVLAQHHQGTDGTRPMFLVARALTRGKGKTQGYHSLVIPVANEVARMLDNGSRQERLAEAAQARLAIVAELKSILRSSLHAYAGSHTDIPKHWTDLVEESANATFWQDLERELLAPDAGAERLRWTRETMIPATEEALRSAQASIPATRTRRYSSIAAANSIFTGMLWNSKKLPRAQAETETTETQA